MHESVSQLLDRLLDAAEAHGLEEGYATQIGDLEEILRAIFEVATPGQVAAMMRDPRVVALLEVPEYEDIAYDPGA